MNKDTYPSGQKKSSTIGSGVVGQTNLDTITREFMTVCGGDNPVSFKPGVCNLTGDVLVRHTHNHAILGGIIFILVLNDETFSGIVISFALTTPPELDLESLEVSFALDYLDERLQWKIPFIINFKWVCNRDSNEFITISSLQVKTKDIPQTPYPYELLFIISFFLAHQK